MRMDYPGFKVVVCDNGSSDGSVGYIKKWAEGNLDVSTPSTNQLKRLSFPPLRKPVPYVTYEKKDIENKSKEADSGEKLIIIKNGENLGFAAGNNVGLRYASERNDFAYAWLLNNDTVVEKDALGKIISRMEKEQGAGACGSTILEYNSPDTIQTLGGWKHDKWCWKHATIEGGESKNILASTDADTLQTQLSYITGASICVSRQFIQTIGLLSEDYFFYGEDLDWSARGKKEFKLLYSKESVVYHKWGGTLNINSANAYYHYCKSTLLNARKHYRRALPFVYMLRIMGIIKNLLTGRPEHAMMAVKAMSGR